MESSGPWIRLTWPLSLSPPGPSLQPGDRQARLQCSEGTRAEAEKEEKRACPGPPGLGSWAPCPDDGDKGLRPDNWSP